MQVNRGHAAHGDRQLDVDGAADGPLTRALRLLDVVAAAGEPVRFSEVQQAAGLPKATLSRLLRQLEAEGMLAFDPASRRYRLGLRLVRLAHAAWEGATLVEAARPVLDRLVGDVGMTVHLACLDGGQVLYLDKRLARPAVRMFSAPGRIGPAHCTGVGKAMLAFLPADAQAEAIARQSFVRHTPRTIVDPAALAAELDAIRARGHAVDDQEHEETIVCLAVPILAPAGGLVGGLSLTTTIHAGGLAALERHRPALAAAAAEIAVAAETMMLAPRGATAVTNDLAQFDLAR
ncbi:IclR family transcriptional regulator [Oharaeibacter diazotrophicus]|uniref:IclR family transcriptional regulator n=1 Tax=Oharaeibacter diazotrophicus TaxID=1920512 RepID=UPI001A992331|nr:IclR family transcriptional regulator [Oharaeibacter diazotrophicus]